MLPVERAPSNGEALRALLQSQLSPTILARLDEVCERSRLSVREILEQAIDFAWHVQMSGELDGQPHPPHDEDDAPLEPAPTRYNGWTNYETWAVHLWLTNDEGSYNYCRGLAERAANDAPACEQVREGIWTVEEARKFILADQLKDSVEHMNPLGDKATMFTDLLNAALSEVNWHEIADAFLEE